MQNKIEYKTFYQTFSKLSNTKQKIVFETICRMDHGRKRPSVNNNIFKLIKDTQKKLNISNTELRKKLKQKLNYEPSEKTMESFFSRKSLGSDLLEPTLEILNIPLSDVFNNNNIITLQSLDVTSLSWQFNSLSISNKQAAYYLVQALYMSEHSPELLDDFEIGE